MRPRVVVAAVFFLLGGCSSPSGPERELDGVRLFAQHCARCHGADGKPTAEFPQARDLSDPRIVGLLKNEQIKGAIQMGKPPTMPAFGGRFTDAKLEVLVAHVRSLSGAKGDRARPTP